MKLPKTESKTVEFKKSFNQDTIESLVAFANAEGGIMYVGSEASFEDHGTWFKVVVRKLGEKLGETRKSILLILQSEPFLSIPKLAARIGMSATAVEKNLALLKSTGHLLRIGGAKGGHWEVK